MSKPLRKAWKFRHTAMLALLFGVGAWFHREALLDIITIGIGNKEQSHIVLAPLIAAWLFWLRRSRLRSLRIAPSLWGPAFILVGWLMSWLGLKTDTQVAWHAGALLTLFGGLVSLTGLAPVRQFAPAFLAMLFLIPVPGLIRQAIAVPLQAMATGIVYMLLELFGVSVTRLGHVLMINGEQIAVGEACNGMRMVFALGLVVYAFAFSTALRPVTQVLLLALSPITALFVNVIRLVPTSLFFGYGSVEQARTFHDLSGWVMLPVALLILIGVLRLFRWIELPVTSFRLVAQ